MEILLLVPVIYLIIETILGYKRGLIKSVLLLISWIVSFVGSALLVREFVTGSEKISEFAALFEGIIGPRFYLLKSSVILLFVFQELCPIFR